MDVSVVSSDASAAEPGLSEALTERVLARLGLSAAPAPTLDGLKAIYGAWCRRVPFDNVRKMIAVRAGLRTALPGSTPEDFFEAWLKHGTGGTCWAGAGALRALLVAVGFEATRGVATMLAAPKLPPNHGTVLVTLGDPPVRYLSDASILHGEPLALPADEQSETVLPHPAWGVRCLRADGRWQVWWRPLHRPDGFVCRCDGFGASHEEYVRFYEQTRSWSPFNCELNVRLNRGEEVIGAAFGRAVTLHRDGRISQTPVGQPDRVRFLVEEIGLSEEIARQLPEDTPTPPPPGSQTAQRLAAE